MRWETKGPFLVSTELLGFLSIFKKSQASSAFEALNSVCLSRYQSDVIPPIQMRRTTMAFSRVSTGDSDIPASYKLKTCVSGNFCSCLKEVKPLVVYDGEQGIVLEPMQGNWA